MERSRPPQYSPELRALLGSDSSRTKGKPITPSHIERPPILPPRADPDSDEARWLGPFSKRRRVNIHWRYFTSQWQSVYPPLEVSVRSRPEGADHVAPTSHSTDASTFNAAGIRSVGLQESGVLQELQALAGPSARRPAPPRRQRQTFDQLDDSPPSSSEPPIEAPNRFLRRRYRELLARIPILTYTPSPSKAASSNPGQSGKYTVSLPNTAISRKVPSELGLPDTDAIDEAWLQQYAEDPPAKKKEKKTATTTTTKQG